MNTIETRKKFLEKAKKQSQEAFSRKDSLVIQAVRALDDFDQIKSLLQQRVAEWFKINFPDLRANEDVISKIAAEFGSKENFEEGKLSEIVGKEKANAIMRIVGESYGAKFDKKDAAALQVLASQAVSIGQARDEAAAYIDDCARREFRNIAELADPVLAARLLSLAGSLKNLAEMPASTIQVIGAETSLFKHLRQHSNPPKHGIIFQHPAINGSPMEQRGRIARALATKLAIAAKADYFTGNYIAEKLKADFEKRLKQIQTTPRKPRAPARPQFQPRGPPNRFRDSGSRDSRPPRREGGFRDSRPPSGGGFRDSRREGGFRPRSGGTSGRPAWKRGPSDRKPPRRY